MDIDLITWIPLTIWGIMLVSLFAGEKLTWYTALFGAVIGTVLTIYLAPFNQYIILPLKVVAFYGGSIGFEFIASFILLSALVYSGAQIMWNIAVHNEWFR